MRGSKVDRLGMFKAQGFHLIAIEIPTVPGKVKISVNIPNYGLYCAFKTILGAF